MLNSTAKNLLVYIALLFYISGCGDGGESGSVPATSSSGLLVPSINLATEGDNTSLSWNDSNASQYRVLYWVANDTPQEHITTSTTYTNLALSSGVYTFIVEAYDELGNSLFSAPVTLEVA